MRRRWRPAAVCALAAVACSDRPGQPRRLPLEVATLQISASVGGTPVSALVATVSAANIQPALVFNIEAANGIAAGTIALPVGTGRTILVRAVDASGATTHEGSAQVDVRPGVNPVVTITLAPLAGTQPIEVRIGDVLVSVTPGHAVLWPRDVVTLSVRATDVKGAPVAVDPAAVRWASFDARIATVDTRGVVTAHRTGEVQVVATYAGAAGGARLTVGPSLLSAGDIARCDQPDDEATAAILDTLQGVVATLGDNAYENGTLAEFNNCYHPSWGRHKARTRPTPGNHEYRTLNAAGYFDYFGAAAAEPGKGYYSYAVGAWRVIAINSVVSVAAGSTQLAWLRTELAAAPAKCVLAYWHRPRFSSGAHHGSDANMEPLWEELYAAGADVVLAGHEHLYERFAPQTPAGIADSVRGIRQFTAGTGGGVPYTFRRRRAANSEFRLSQSGVLALVLGEGRYAWRFITAFDGLVRDSGSGPCH